MKKLMDIRREGSIDNDVDARRDQKDTTHDNEKPINVSCNT